MPRAVAASEAVAKGLSMIWRTWATGPCVEDMLRGGGGKVIRCRSEWGYVCIMKWPCGTDFLICITKVRRERLLQY